MLLDRQIDNQLGSPSQSTAISWDESAWDEQGSFQQRSCFYEMLPIFARCWVLGGDVPGLKAGARISFGSWLEEECRRMKMTL